MRRLVCCNGTRASDDRAERVGVQANSWMSGEAIPPLIFLMLYIAAHALLITLVPAHAPVISVAFTTGAPALAAVACVRRAQRGDGAKSWWAVALAMLLWSAGMAANLPFLADNDGTLNPGVSMVLFVLYMAPLMFVLAWHPEDPATVRRIDAGLALVLAGLFCAVVAGHASLVATPLENVPALRAVYDAGNTLVVGLAFIRWLAGAGLARRELFGALAIYAAIYFVVAYYINHLEAADAGYGIYADLAIDFPFLVLACIAYVRPAPVVQGTPRRIDKIVHLASPLVLPVALLLASAHLMPTQPWLAAFGIAVATTGYGARTVLIQLHSQEQLERLAAAATIDALTEVANRRHFDERLAREWRLTSASLPAMSLLLVDVDHFKAINDRVGHPGGDQCLRAVAQIMKVHAEHAGGFTARYGGEEFAVLAALRDAAQAQALAERIRIDVAESEACRKAAGGRVTVSIGVAVAVDRTNGVAHRLVDAADVALYRAKNAGRNCAVLHPSDAAVDSVPA